MKIVACALLTAIIVCGARPAASEEFYKGKVIRLIVGSQVGASYDSYARSLARHMPKHIPGNPKIVVQNLPGAGGLLAANTLYNIAQRDGTTIGMLNRVTILAALVGNEQARYKAERFNWLGTAASFENNAFLFIIRSALPYKTVDDLRRPGPPLHVGESGSPIISLLKKVFHLNVSIIKGYGKGALDLAFERGEVDGEGFAYANLLARRPDWLKKKFIRVMIQFGHTKRFSAYPNVPTGQEIAATAQDRDVVELAESSLRIAYPFAMPPDVPPELVATMQRAFMQTMNDPAYRNDVTKGKLEYSPKDGIEVQRVIERVASMAPETIARYKDVISNTKSAK
jgi:tripartite-type tricarboxylate transporter receptor subunit TctC